MTKNRWDNGITHHDGEAREFISTYFSQTGRRVLILASAGFDLRSTAVSRAIAQTGVTCRGIFIREERPNADQALRARADKNAEQLKIVVPDSKVVFIDIFDPVDQAVVGARRLTRDVLPILAEGEPPTDIVVDASALSIGISFPLVRLLDNLYGQKPGTPNVHLFVTEDPHQDDQVKPDHAERPMWVPGCDGDAGSDLKSKSIRLWIPQLVLYRTEALRRIHDFVDATETCPILPFPARDLRRGDVLLEHYRTLLIDTWEVDPRSYIFAAEREPLDLYRTLLRIDDARQKVYGQQGGSLMVLSPIGSKLLGLGALLAALDRDFPVAYLETVSYAAQLGAMKNLEPDDWPIVHLWLSGVPYA
ncbi:hypothetical protein [Nevskia ramosa]|uniref:hypothetical protein n=1 Tax=Nevskia ramosa TaxID=64002 RepID=UPI00235273FB|nr:hypothetical protein [Nevskia ramosa]